MSMKIVILIGFLYSMKTNDAEDKNGLEKRKEPQWRTVNGLSLSTEWGHASHITHWSL